MRNAARIVVRHRAAEFVFRHFFVRDSLDDVGAGHKHVAGLVDHRDEIRNGGRINGTTGARSHNCRDLRNDSRSERVSQKNVGVSGQRHDAFLNPGASGVI